MTPHDLRIAADKLREADDVLDALNHSKPSIPGWSMLIGFDLRYLADQFDRQAEYISGNTSDDR